MTQNHEPFDRVVEAEIGGKYLDLVVHLDVNGDILVFHSPLRHDTTIQCSICAGGARVYVS